jgi:hypothetical protein
MMMALAMTLPISAHVDAGPDRHLIGRSLRMPGSQPARDTTGDERAIGLSERYTTDQQDAAADNSTHLIYFVPSDSPDQSLDTNGAITNSIRSVRAWFLRETQDRRPRIDTLSTGGYDISYVAGKNPAATYTTLDLITEELRAKGFEQADKRYMIYAAVDRDDVCGESYYPLPPLRDKGQYAAIYLNSNDGCGARNFGGGGVANAGKAETIVAHEWLHAEGVAPMAAPHYCASNAYHVCTGPLWVAPIYDPEAFDVVFPYITDALSAMHLDRDHDDYFDHGWAWLPNVRDSAWLETS